jgi:hypothetical protein
VQVSFVQLLDRRRNVAIHVVQQVDARQDNQSIESTRGMSSAISNEGKGRE